MHKSLYIYIYVYTEPMTNGRPWCHSNILRRLRMLRTRLRSSSRCGRRTQHDVCCAGNDGNADIHHQGHSIFETKHQSDMPWFFKPIICLLIYFRWSCMINVRIEMDRTSKKDWSSQRSKIVDYSPEGFGFALCNQACDDHSRSWLEGQGYTEMEQFAEKSVLRIRRLELEGLCSRLLHEDCCMKHERGSRGRELLNFDRLLCFFFLSFLQSHFAVQAQAVQK